MESSIWKVKDEKKLVLGPTWYFATYTYKFCGRLKKDQEVNANIAISLSRVISKTDNLCLTREVIDVEIH